MKNKTITWQQVFIAMKPLDCITNDFFVMKEHHPVKHIAKRIKQILHAEH